MIKGIKERELREGVKIGYLLAEVGSCKRIIGPFPDLKAYLDLTMRIPISYMKIDKKMKYTQVVDIVLEYYANRDLPRYKSLLIGYVFYCLKHEKETSQFGTKRSANLSASEAMRMISVQFAPYNLSVLINSHKGDSVNHLIELLVKELEPLSAKSKQVTANPLFCQVMINSNFLPQEVIRNNRIVFNNLDSPNILVPFAGAGVSIGCGLPDWKGLLCRIAEKYFSQTEIQIMSGNDPYMFADEIMKKTGVDVVHKQVKNEIVHLMKTSGKTCNYLNTLLDGFGDLIVTTNYDTCLEKTDTNHRFISCLAESKQSLTDALVKGGARIIHLHGSIEDPTTVVLGTADYVAKYGQNSNPLPLFLEDLFSTRKTLFVGCSLQDDQTLKVLERCFVRNASITHYAIMEYPGSLDLWNAENVRLGKLGIEVIYFPKGKFDEIANILRCLAEHTINYSKVFSGESKMICQRVGLHVFPNEDIAVRIQNDGTVIAMYGLNPYGELEAEEWTDMIQIDAGNHFVIGLDSQHMIHYSGIELSQEDKKLLNLTGAKEVRAYYFSFFVVTQDGRVLHSEINNAELQKDISTWNGIVHVSVGGFSPVYDRFVLGVKLDGTVVGAGNNQYGQCNTTTWSDVIQVATGAKFSLGLKKNGKVICTGDVPFEKELATWHDIVSIAAGLYHVIACDKHGKLYFCGDNSRYEIRLPGEWNALMVKEVYAKADMIAIIDDAENYYETRA